MFNYTQSTFTAPIIFLSHFLIQNRFCFLCGSNQKKCALSEVSPHEISPNWLIKRDVTTVMDIQMQESTVQRLKSGQIYQTVQIRAAAMRNMNSITGPARTASTLGSHTPRGGREVNYYYTNNSELFGFKKFQTLLGPKPYPERQINIVLV